MVLILAVVGTAWSVAHALTARDLRFSDSKAEFILAIAGFPGLVRDAYREVLWMYSDDPHRLLIDRNSVDKSNVIRRFPAPEDSGYLLLSGVDPKLKRSTVKLIRISDDALVARWLPDWPAIFDRITTPAAGRAVHPLLLPEGDIVFNLMGRGLVRQSICSSKPLWVLDEQMHHSNELGIDGDIWVPSVSSEGLADKPWLAERITDDALARISTDGHVLERRSFARILIDNELHALLLGTSRLKFKDDPIHINQIQVAHRDAQHWKRGDLLISARHLSTVFLYRPSTNRILWHQTGPWMNQHSVDFVDEHRISVFDNNVVAGISGQHAFISPGDTNRVILYDFDTAQISQPYAALLAEARPVSVTEGRARVLPDGGLFVEETNYGRHLRFTRDRMLWSRVNDYDAQRIGGLGWSRYLTADEVQGPLQALTSKKCRSNPINR